MEDKKNNTRYIVIAGIAVAGVVALWILFDTDRNISTLFSGLAFAGIIFTVLLQKEELGLQRKEIRETRREFEQQNATMKLQRFENTFFNLLSLLQKIVDGIDIDEQRQKNQGWMSGVKAPEYETITFKGRDVFRKRYSILSERLGKAENVLTINQIYLDYYDSIKTDFGHYFKTVYRIVKLVDEAELDFDEKYKYVAILRAQLSDYELLWLFYNGLCEYGQKFKPLIEKYSVLNNMPAHEIHNEALLEQYAESAFENKNKL